MNSDEEEKYTNYEDRINIMNHYEVIYQRKADAYHRMIKSEDFEGNLLPAIEKFTSFEEKRLLDIGSGTGRIPLLLHNQTKMVISLDKSLAMLQEQKIQRDLVNGQWSLSLGDMRRLPFCSNYFDYVIAGWAIGHFCSWYEKEWKTQIGFVLGEMHRMVVKGGAVLIIETMTTGSLYPAPPTSQLAKYYEWLEEEWGFTKVIIRTDLKFKDIDAAIQNTDFFFGNELTKKIQENRWSRIPEWTGIWGKMI